MSLNNAEFEKVEEQDLLQLIESQVAEGILIEYKRDLYGRSDDDKRELLKDTSSFANTAGGHIVVGMEESGGLPIELLGVSGDIDVEMQRFESLFRDCVEPRIVGLRMKGIRLKSGRSVLVIRIPRSWNPAHAVTFRGMRRYWARNSAGAHEASVEELRAMFNVAAAVWERALNFQKERLILVQRNEGAAQIPQQGLLLHIIPFAGFTDGRLDPRKMTADLLVPLWQMGCTPSYNFDGFLVTSGNDRRRGYVQAFRNCILEAAVGGILEETPHGSALFAEEVEDHLTTGLTRYMEALSRAQVPPPMIVLLAAFRMTGSYVAPSQHDPRREIVHLRKSDMFFPPITIENYATLEDYRLALRPIFDALWNAAGYPGSPSYNVNGQWARKT
jgi:hypothetical protein